MSGCGVELQVIRKKAFSPAIPADLLLTSARSDSNAAPGELTQVVTRRCNQLADRIIVSSCRSNGIARRYSALLRIYACV